nr:MAG TPA: hypothetical protein [Caudoviricetes sp.]
MHKNKAYRQTSIDLRHDKIIYFEILLIADYNHLFLSYK